MILYSIFKKTYQLILAFFRNHKHHLKLFNFFLSLLKMLLNF